MNNFTIEFSTDATQFQFYELLNLLSAKENFICIFHIYKEKLAQIIKFIEL